MSRCVDVLLQYNSFESNEANSCGGLAILLSSVVLVEGSTFVRNVVGSGAAVCVADGSANVVIRDSIFSENTASASGGAVHVLGCKNVSMVQCNFTANVARLGDGSAVWVSSSTNSVLQANRFVGNVASAGAGTVYWVASSGMGEPVGLTWSGEGGNSFSESNVALYGPHHATEGSSLVTDTVALDMLHYDRAAPAVSIWLQDYYGQVVLSDSQSSASVAVSSEVFSSCAGYPGFVSGTTTVGLSNGSAVFDALDPLCAPTFNLTLSVTSSLQSVSEPLLFRYDFRECDRGEYFIERVCKACDEGSYSFVDPSSWSLSELTRDNVCSECPAGAEECYGSEILVRRGYWRVSWDSSHIFECPLGEDSCLGGNRTGEESCGEGYTGALCAVCEGGYHFSDTMQACEPCEGAVSWVDSMLAALVLVLLGSLCVIGYMFKQRIAKRERISSLDEMLEWLLSSVRYWTRSELSATSKAERVASVGRSRRQLQHRMKIYVIMLQIVVALPFVLSLDMPTAYHSVMNPLRVVNLGLSESSVASCSFASGFDFVDQLLFQTVYPMVVLCCLAVACKWEMMRSGRRRRSLLEDEGEGDAVKVLADSEEESRQGGRIVSKYMSVAILFLSLTLPFTSTIIFSVFPCHDIDPDSQVSGDNSYMTADYSVSCESDRYYFALVWAVLMILVYPIGVPVLFACLLYRSKHDITSRYEVLGDERKEIARARRLEAVRSLFDAYRPEYWYWELIETYYRLSLTGFLVLVKQGSSSQIFTGLALAFMYAKVHDMVRPLESSRLNFVKSVSLWQVCLVFFFALVTFAELASKGNAAFNAFMVCTLFVNVPLECMVSSVSRYRTFEEKSDREVELQCSELSG